MAHAEALTTENYGDFAAELSELVQADESWMRDNRLNTFRRFSDADVALESLGRLVQRHDMSGFVLSDNGQSVGLGTQVHDLTIRRPAGSKAPWLMRGPQIDYWTRENIDSELEMAVVLDLLGCAAVSGRGVLATMSPGEEQRARAVRAIMDPVGNPGPVRVPFWKPDYDLRTAGSVQVFQYQPRKL